VLLHIPKAAWVVIHIPKAAWVVDHPGCLGNANHGGAGGTSTTSRASIEFLDGPKFHSLYMKNPLKKQKA
jgi:hypothetical protein